MTPPIERDRVPAPVAYFGTAVVGLTALVVLAWYQHALIQRGTLDSPAFVAWTFSIGLDIGSAVAGVYWFFGTRALRRLGMWVSLGLLTLSTIICCLSWGLGAGWWWAPLGAVHPMVFGLMGKLLTLWQAQVAEDAARDAAEDTERRERERQAVERVQRKASKAGRPAAVQDIGQSVSARMRAWIRAELAAGREVTAAGADRQFGLVGTARVGQRELRKVQTETEATG